MYKNDSKHIGKRPLFSLIMPVYNPPEPFFGFAVRSILDQYFTDWELCMVDDASTDASVWPKMQSYATSDRRIKVSRRIRNGHISRATNAAAELASGEYLAFIDQDDELAPRCLEHMARYLAKYPDTDLLYTDDDKINEQGVRYAAQFKQDFDPFQLLSFMALGHIMCVRRVLYEALGGFRAGFEGSQDYDFALRAVEHARHVGHVPSVAYHWRSLPGSTAAGGGEKAYSFNAGLRAVQEALDRRGIPARAIHPEWALASGCGLFGVAFAPGSPVTVIMPVMKDDPPPDPSVLARILAAEHPRASFMLAVDASCSLPELPVGLQLYRIAAATRAALCNTAAQAATTQWIVFLSPTLSPHDGNWLTQLAGWAALPGVGCVGGKIYREDGVVLHAGYLHGLEKEGLPGRVEYGRPDSWGHHFRLVTPNRCSAVSEACLAIDRRTFLAIDGFDADCFPDSLSGADLGYRLAKRNLASVFCPEARFTCTRSTEFSTADEDAERLFKNRHPDLPRAVSPHFAYGTEFAPRAYHLPDMNRPTLKTLMISHGLAPEGAPKTLLELTVGLSDRGSIAPEVWSHADGPLRRVYAKAGIPVSIIPCVAESRILPCTGTDLNIYVRDNLAFLPMDNEDTYNTAINGFARRMINRGIDVVVANTVLAFWAVEAAERAKIPSLWIIRESEPPFLHLEGVPAFLRFRAKRSLATPYRVVFVAEATMRLFSDHIVNNNALVVHNALSPRFIKNWDLFQRGEARSKMGIDDQEIVVLTLGSVFERKGQLDVASACAVLEEQHLKKIRFLIVGDRPGTPYSFKLHQALEALPEERRRHVMLIPETSHPEMFYRAADIFLCCSRIESYPRVILEAMHCALPIITTPIFGIREQVHDGDSALFYDPGDIPDLCRNIVRLSEDPKLRHTLGFGARHALELLPDYDDMLTHYQTLLYEAASQD